MKFILALVCAALSWQAMAQEPIIRDSLQNLNSNFHFQFTTVTQHKYKINAPYTGLKSLTVPAETATTLTATIFWGSKLWNHAALYINPEVAGGSGVSSAQGIAGFTNGEAFRVGNPSPTVYLARMFLQQTFNLGGEQVYVGGGANEVYKKRSRKYIDLVVGKFSIADYFDKNSYSHDPRSQFLNWGLMSNGAWDYPANVRGYTWGVVVEYGTPKYSLRAASSMVPSEANGNTMDKNYAQANSNVIEFEKHYLINKQSGKIRALGFYTHAHMGNYLQAINENPTNPDITLTRAYGRTKYGFGINIEQSLSDNVGLFARAGWNDGYNETWAFTEIDRTASLGLFIDGAQWKRMNDQFGFGSVVNGLSSYHRDYLASGGYGFILGDGQLNYSHEWITEVFYRANLFSDTFYVTPNFQFVVNPAYNKDRGPATIVGLRVHVEF
jgi:high affinity Mn2+ porin